jgi:hypothetical protein
VALPQQEVARNRRGGRSGCGAVLGLFIGLLAAQGTTAALTRTGTSNETYLAVTIVVVCMVTAGLATRRYGEKALTWILVVARWWSQ